MSFISGSRPLYFSEDGLQDWTPRPHQCCREYIKYHGQHYENSVPHANIFWTHTRQMISDSADVPGETQVQEQEEGNDQLWFLSEHQTLQADT